ncbi:hypothetical protein KM914_16305 [Virgibacillus pantothenticus]|uniref:hypothetical protein n=1 Tax=Virgibacillus pantothenticus TaxID=1473 RepID=UPI001C2221B8|nr:hypothetical protein [Virgibacillus pantothenticus]MBU8567962.1 hypothetical protein [Virgibacillus pantothenticus]MBU8601782.1 hypothetical protein [Virgibacillus pantothenticus]MBU8635936.1 hypothetical protein [Virgibacillus pantothenticus]MBU8643620.1 hypothetical protein [Virgibacillus pantothenticus]MBU8647760.1 hypothetical protein [Virgibacillus pantothenticus]
MNLKKYVELILEEFNLPLDEEKYNYSNFSVYKNYNDHSVSYDYVLYTFSQNYPYLIFYLRNNTNKIARQLIYVNSKPLIIEGEKNNIGEIELYAHDDVFDYEEITQIVANRIIEVFPYEEKKILINILDDIMQNFRNTVEKFIDKRYPIILDTTPNVSFEGNSFDFTLKEIIELPLLNDSAISNALEEQRAYFLEAIKYGFVAKEDLLLFLEGPEQYGLKLEEDSYIYEYLDGVINNINHNLEYDAANDIDFSIDISSGEDDDLDYYLYSVVEKVNKRLNEK